MPFLSGHRWDKDELKAAVRAYVRMLNMAPADLRKNKRAIIEKLMDGALSGRSKRAIRMRFSNISHVRQRSRRRTVKGFAPLKNVGEPNVLVIMGFLEELNAPE